MLDRVAAEIAAEIMELTTEQRATFRVPDDANGDTCDRARSAARMVMWAMRDPTLEMELAADDRLSAGHFESVPVSIVWDAMIDEALK